MHVKRHSTRPPHRCAPFRVRPGSSEPVGLPVRPPCRPWARPGFARPPPGVFCASRPPGLGPAQRR
eukprot:2383397-Lingulodinium_polyedra.AAC.1